MPEECAIDTSVLQKANALVTKRPRPTSVFARRIRLLRDVFAGRRTVLISRRLLAEYRSKLPSPRNDVILAFFAFLADPARPNRIENWPRWRGSDREKARKCRFPAHDNHVLRTAIRPNRSAIITEDSRMLQADKCIYRDFRVHIVDIVDV